MEEDFTMRNDPQPYVRSVKKAADILGVLADRASGASVTEVAQVLGFSPSTVHRLLTSLVRVGMVEQDRQTLRYLLGYRILQLAQAKLEGLNLPSQVAPVLDRLRTLTGETASFFIPVAAGCLCVEQFQSPNQVRCVARIGDVLPLDRGAVGRVLSVGERDSIDVEVSSEEVNIGMCGMAAPIVDAARAVRGALTLSIPRQRWDEQESVGWAEALRRAATDVSLRLGWVSRNGGVSHGSPGAWSASRAVAGSDGPIRNGDRPARRSSDPGRRAASSHPDIGR